MTRVLAIVPARKWSGRFRDKNLRTVGGVSLIGRAVDVARRCTNIDEVVLSTDYSHLRFDGVRVLERPSSLRDGSAAIEDVIDDVLSRVDQQPTHVVLLNPTSPLRRRHTVDVAIGYAKRSDLGTVATVVPGLGELDWGLCGAAVSLTRWTTSRKPRTQDMALRYEEHGCAFVLRVEAMDRRTSYPWPAMAIPTSPAEAIDIDHEADLRAAEALVRGVPEYAERDEIVPGLWVGTAESATASDYVVDMQSVRDFDLPALRDSLDAKVDEIAQAHGAGLQTLVACKEGRVRSATAALAYLVARYRMGLIEAWRLLHERRDCLPMVQVVDSWRRDHDA